MFSSSYATRRHQPVAHSIAPGTPNFRIPDVIHDFYKGKSLSVVSLWRSPFGATPMPVRPAKQLIIPHGRDAEVQP